MIVIIFLDDNEGMAFNHRRQSRDQAVTERIRQIALGKKLWMSPYSYKLYGDMDGTKTVEAEDFLDRAGQGELCLVEAERLAHIETKIEKIIAFRWNRRYPADVRLDLCLAGWRREETREFPGTSHEKITEEVYIQKKEF
ncbi:MAG: ribonuclease Z [Dorea sp.]|nr:ribonuclease Z [Dorea sp.]